MSERETNSPKDDREMANEEINYAMSFIMTYDVAQEIGDDACDSWAAMAVLCGAYRSTTLSYACEFKAFFTNCFSK